MVGTFNLHALSRAGRAIDGLHQRQASPPFRSVATRLSVCSNRVEIIFDERAFRAGQFKPARVAGKQGGGRLQNSQSPAGKLQKRRQRILGFHHMQSRSGHRLNTFHFAEHPQHKIQCVYRLVDQRAAAIEFQGPAPSGVRIIFRRPVLLHTRVRGLPSAPESTNLFIENVRLTAILEKYTQLHPGFPRFGDQNISTLYNDVDGLFSQHMQALPCGRNSLFRVNPEGLPIATISMGRCAINFSNSE